MNMRQAMQILKNTRARTVRLLDGLDQTGLDWSPGEGKWSLGQVVDHLLLAERLYRGQIAELVERTRKGRAAVIRLSFKEVNFRPNFVPKAALPLLEAPFLFLNLFISQGLRDFMLLNRVMPAQSPDVALPQAGRTLEEAREALRKSVADTDALIEANSDLDFTKMYLEHPILGRNTAPQLIRVTALHEQRHQKQMEGLLEGMARRAA